MPDNQLDLFICEAMDFGFRDDIVSMETPLFSLTSGRKPDTRVKVYQHNGEIFEITPSAAGHATIFDKDILLYCISYLMEAINREEPVSKRVKITLHDFVTTTMRSTGGKNYKLVTEALKRLKGTQIVSTVLERLVAEEEGRSAIKDIRRITGVGLIEDWQVNVDEQTGRMESILITLPEWLFINIKRGAVLKINPEYFGLRRGLDRRLYEIGRKHTGKKNSWKIGVDLLHKKSGSTADLRKFRQMLAVSISKNLIPDFNLEYEDESQRQVKFIALPESSSKVLDLRPKARQKMRARATKKENDKIIKANGTNENATCPICQREFANRGVLGSHMRVHKREPTLEPTDLEKLEIRTCPICEKVCKSRAGLSSHMRSHRQ